MAILTRVIAYPNLFRTSRSDAAHTALIDHTEIIPLEITADCGTLIGYMAPCGRQAAPLVLYFGGNGTNAATTLMSLHGYRAAAFSNVHVAMVDYPGYGQSEGKPSDITFKQSALAIYDALAAREDVTEIIVIGYSIGTGPASYVASRRDVSGLILMAPYAHVADLFNNVVNMFYGPFKPLATCGYNMSPVRFAKHVDVEPLLLVAERDNTVSYDSIVHLGETFPAGYELVTIPGIKHNEFWYSGTTLREIGEYFDQVTGSP